MTTIDSSWNERGDGAGDFVFTEEIRDQVNAMWNAHCLQHIDPGRLMEIAVGLAAPTHNDNDHLASCSRCRSVFDRYQTVDRATDVDSTRTKSVAESAPGLCAGACNNGQRRQSTLFDLQEPRGGLPRVPSVLRTNLQMSGPVLFPNGEVAFETWQLGRLEHIRTTNADLAESLANLVVARADSIVRPLIKGNKVAIVCFGRILHRLGTRLATRFVESGSAQPHVILAHDFYSPALVCASDELRGADVTVMVDVSHTGQQLERLFRVCREKSPARLRGVAVIRQGASTEAGDSVLGLWYESPEDRMSLDEFVCRATPDELQQLTRFEPNDECAVSAASRRPAQLGSGGRSNLVTIKPAFVEMIQKSGALHRDYLIGNKRYPFVINVLDLLRDPQCRATLLSMACARLSEIGSGKSCLAYRADRSRRAGKIAKMLGSAVGWPAVSLGSRDELFCLSSEQCRRLLAFRNIVIVDAALRTGESLFAVSRALNRAMDVGRRVSAFCILNALSEEARCQLACSLGIEIRTVFEVPLAPPSERVTTWISSQKSLIRAELARTNRFADVEGLLSGYCSPGGQFPRRGQRSLNSTKAALERASVDALSVDKASERVGIACEQGASALIRHLPIAQVVHDRGLQDLLLGVMYNSMPPSFKESAVFALSAARNYEWMTYEWLQCNRRFLASQTNCWKSVLMVECQMRIAGQAQELGGFKDSLEAFVAKLSKDTDILPERNNSGPQQQTLFEPKASRHQDSILQFSEHGGSERRLRERAQLMIEVAGE